MKSQFIKDVYYATVGKATIVPLVFNRTFRRRSFSGKFVQIGSGHCYVPGMINIEGNIFLKKDLWLDVTLGLPFADNSIKGIYSCHVMEHLNIANNRAAYREFMRVLEPGAKIRLVVPSLEYAVKAYVERDESKFPNWPDRFRSIGGKFNNYTLVANQHFVMFDFSLMEELLSEAGFTDIQEQPPSQSDYFTPEHLQYEATTQWDGFLLSGVSLIVEARKPVAAAAGRDNGSTR